MEKTTIDSEFLIALNNSINLYNLEIEPIVKDYYLSYILNLIFLNTIVISKILRKQKRMLILELLIQRILSIFKDYEQYDNLLKKNIHNIEFELQILKLLKNKLATADKNNHESNPLIIEIFRLLIIFEIDRYKNYNNQLSYINTSYNGIEFMIPNREENSEKENIESMLKQIR